MLILKPCMALRVSTFVSCQKERNRSHRAPLSLSRLNSRRLVSPHAPSGKVLKTGDKATILLQLISIACRNLVLRALIASTVSELRGAWTTSLQFRSSSCPNMFRPEQPNAIGPPVSCTMIGLAGSARQWILASSREIRGAPNAPLWGLCSSGGSRYRLVQFASSTDTLCPVPRAIFGLLKHDRSVLMASAIPRGLLKPPQHRFDDYLRKDAVFLLN